MSIEQTILENLKVLSPLQQQELLDFSEFLKHKSASHTSLSEKQNSDQPQNCYDLALELGVIGVAENLPPDLSTNPAYFEGFGT
ncbi:MAG: hypothetical protein VKJ02_14465 [Snowella sp.]|nr:hypothetical protein [Snowella sp.]